MLRNKARKQASRLLYDQTVPLPNGSAACVVEVALLLSRRFENRE